MSQGPEPEAPRAGRRDYGLALGAVLAATGLRWALDPLLGDQLPFLTYIVALLVVAWRGGLGPALATLALGALLAAWLFAAPRGELLVAGASERLRLAAFVLLGLVIIGFIEAMRRAQRRVQQQAARLRASQADYERLYDELPTMMWTLDIDTLRLVECNQRVADALGYTKAELLGKPIAELYPTEGHAEGRRMRERFLESGEVRDVELQLQRKDGGLIDVSLNAIAERDADGRIVRSRTVWLDVTQRRRAERELQALRNRLAEQVDALTRLHERTTRLSNQTDLQALQGDVLASALALARTDKGALSLYDATRGELELVAGAGFDAAFLRRVERVPLAQAAWGAALAAQRHLVVEDTESDPACAGGRELARLGGFRSAHVTPLGARDGSLIGVVATFGAAPGRPSQEVLQLTDMLARQAAASIENLRLVRALEQADRRKDAFLATLAHELRNPLAPIGSAVALMNAAGAPAAQSQWARAVIERQLHHLTRLIDDLLDAGRIATGKLELRRATVALGDVIAQAVEAARPLIEQRAHRLELALPPAAVWLDADPVRLAQVFTNLLVNAAKFTPRGGHIALTARLDDGAAVVTVRDDGVGIEADKLPQLFAMFFQVDGSLGHSQGGLGLGLALAQRLLALHGGQVVARSEGAGRGSEFEVRLPLPPAPGDAPHLNAPTADAATASAARRILVADDNQDAADSLALLLRMAGHEVRTAHDGQAALELAADWRPEVALLDLGMPRMDGFEAARRIRAAAWGEAMLLVAQTGWGQDEDRRRTAAAGFDAHLVKPVDHDALLRLIARGARPAAGASRA